MSGVGAIPVVRGCGTRKKGGVYAECGLSVNGVPIEPESRQAEAVKIFEQTGKLTGKDVSALKRARSVDAMQAFEGIGDILAYEPERRYSLSEIEEALKSITISAKTFQKLRKVLEAQNGN